MAIVPYRSRRDLPSRIFDQFLSGNDLWDEWSFGSARGVLADVYETPDSVVVEMAVPGIKQEDITINVTGDTLTISGERKEEEKREKRNYYQRELRYGSFVQSVALPSTVKSDKAEARFHNGILRVELPKAEEARPKKIQIKSGTA